MSETILKDKLIKLAKNKSQLIEEIIENIDQSIIIENGMMSFVNYVDLFELELEETKDQETKDLFRMIRTISRSVSRQSLINIQLLMLMLIYTSGDQYPRDVDNILIRLGKIDSEIKESMRRAMKNE